MNKYQRLRNNISKIDEGKGIAKFYSGAIFNHTSWFLAKYETPEVVAKQIDRPAVVSSPKKKEVLDSLAKKVEESGSVESKFVNIVKKQKTPALGSKLCLNVDVESYRARLENTYSNFKFKDFTDISTLIVGETSVDELNPQQVHIKTKHDTTELLGKMIIPMKLEEGEFLRTSLVGKSDEEVLQNLLCEISLLKPRVVISLGAVSTNFLYGKKEKLSKIHGNEIERTVDSNTGSFSFTLFPIFHPDLLEINPSMKRTAWIDLQKVMKYLGKV